MQGVGWTNRGDVSVNWCICVLVYLCICYLCVCVFVFLSHGASWQMQGAGWTNRGDVSVNWCAAFSTPDCRLRAPFYPHKPPICEILTSWQIGNDGSTNPTIRKIWQKSNCEIGTIHSFHETEGSGIKLDANNPSHSKMCSWKSMNQSVCDNLNWRDAKNQFLATLVALHFTPVSKW